MYREREKAEQAAAGEVFKQRGPQRVHVSRPEGEGEKPRRLGGGRGEAALAPAGEPGPTGRGSEGGGGCGSRTGHNGRNGS